MRLQDLTLLQFKNYEEAALTFSAHVNCFTGPNGSGKTNLLDAIHYLCMTRSAFTGNDQQNIRQGDDYFMVRGTFEKVLSSGYGVLSTENEKQSPQENEGKTGISDGFTEANSATEEANPDVLRETPETDQFAKVNDRETELPEAEQTSGLAETQHSSTSPLLHSSTTHHTIACTVRAGQKKIITHNRVPYERASEHIGQYPVVLVSPFDTDLIREGSEERRKFFDSLLSQLDHGYLRELILYTQLLKQRNLLLKQFADRNHTDYDLLAVLDEQLTPPAEKIAGARLAFIARFEPVFRRHYQFLAGGSEEVSLNYRSQLTETPLAELLRQNQRKDLMLQRTTTGPHKDDYLFLMDTLPVKNYGSQGQQKSFVIALKLAQFEVLAQDKGFKPLLLLDDIFDRLDEQRIERLLHLVAAHTFGQLFITDTHPERTLALLRPVADELKHFPVRQGHILPGLEG